MKNSYDVIIIGAGHNGLVAAAYLARRGKKVVVLERRPLVGGAVVTESHGEGFSVDSVLTGGNLRPDILKDLKLPPGHTGPRPDFISLQADGQHLTLEGEAIKRFSARDGARWGEFVRFMNRCARILDKAYATIMPRLPRDFDLGDGVGLAKWGLALRLAGRSDMLNFIRALPMTAQELAEEYFESEAVRAAVASLGIHGLTLGPMAAGTGYTLIHNWLNRGGLSHVNVGAAGEITRALAEAVRSGGGEIRTGTEVTAIRVDNLVARGVVLASGEEISAGLILSAADPKHTLLKLVGARELPPEFAWHAGAIKMRGSVAKVHLLTDGSHGIPAGTVVLAPSINYLERAYDAAKYGQISEQPYLEVTGTGSVLSIHFQYAPYALKTGTWSEQRDRLADLALGALAAYFPALRASLVARHVITPQDLQDTYGLTEGDANHGQLMLDQFLFMRPIPGWSNHRTPIDNLYLCGSGVHGGGGISGAAGRNAVRALEA